MHLSGMKARAFNFRLSLVECSLICFFLVFLLCAEKILCRKISTVTVQQELYCTVLRCDDERKELNVVPKVTSLDWCIGNFQ